MAFPQALRALADCGFESVMLLSRPGGPVLTRGETPQACLLDLARSDLDLIEASARSVGLAIVGIYVGGVNPTDPAALADSTRSLRDICDVALRLGCCHIGHSGGRAEAPGMTVADKSEHIRRLAAIADAAASEFAQMRFGVDVHYHGVVESVADCEHYLERLSCDNAGILLNTGHMTTCGEPGWELAASHPDRTPIIGWKDHLVGPGLAKPVVSVQLGTGDAPLERYVATIKPQAVERLHLINAEDVPADRRTEALRASREHMEGLWAALPGDRD